MSDNEDTKVETKVNGCRAKPPKAYKSGEDIKNFISWFKLFAQINKIPYDQNASILLMLLDDKSYEAFNRVSIRDLRDYDTIKQQLISKFSDITGNFGDLVKLKTCKQAINETDIKFVKILGSLAKKAGIQDPKE